jgi:inner membrane protein YidH
MSELNDPRVLFAAERTLLAWNRTASGLIALGFFIDRAALMAEGGGVFATAIGIAFLILGVALNILSVVQYRRSLATLRPAEIPTGYWLNLAVFMSLAVAFLGLLLAAYLLVTL